MKSARMSSLFALVQSYFLGHLRQVRGASSHTVRAYRDGLRLYFEFLARHTGHSIPRLEAGDVRADTVLAFLDNLEFSRHNSVTTRNCRLAAIRAFAAHLVRHDLDRAEQYRRILSIPAKKDRARPILYLEPEEVRALLAQPDKTTARGRRDLALLLFLYNTGARISEALDVRVADLLLRRPRQVLLRGKGRKERICPLWPETTAAIQRLLDHTSVEEGPVYRSQSGAVLSRDAAAHLIRKYAQKAAETVPSLQGRRVTPHLLRHSCAVALLQAGVDLTVIRDYLGHASIATTNRYIATNVEMKRSVLDAFWRRSGLKKSKGSPWRPRPELLAFLASL